MALAQFAQACAELSPGEQAQFAEAVRRLLADGLIWREDESDRRIYALLARRRELFADYLQIAGWELRHHELLGIFHVAQRDGAHRRRLNRDATIWLLLLRLLYAESREKMVVMTTRYPVVTLGEVVHRYAEFFPGQVVRKKTSLEEALRTLAGLKLVRVRRTGSSDPAIELLPTLEVVVPAGEITVLAERLAQYDRTDEESESPRAGAVPSDQPGFPE
jgi:hypothetical protein